MISNSFLKKENVCGLDCISDEIEGEFSKLPVLEKFRPRYVNSLTISIAFPSYEKLIFWANRPLEKIIVLVLLELTL
jgi:hypothetical protein